LGHWVIGSSGRLKVVRAPLSVVNGFRLSITAYRLQRTAFQ